MNPKMAAAAAALTIAFQCLAPAGAKAPMIMSGAQADERVQELTSQISWHHSLSEAQQLARAQHKMIFWVQMLGDISGAT